MVLRKVRENACTRIPITWQYFGAESADIRQSIPASLAQKRQKMWTPCNRTGAKAGQIEAKILFSINKLPAFAHHEAVRTDSNAKRERELAMAKAAVKAKGRAKKKAAKKPAARKRKTRR